MNPTSNVTVAQPDDGAEPYELVIAPEITPTVPIPAFGHELVIGPGLQLILDSNPVNPPLRAKRIICVLALMADPAGLSHEQFSRMYFGHADASRAETWNHIRSLQNDLDLKDFDIHNHSHHFFLKGLQIVKRVPDADLTAFLESYCE